MVDSSWVQVAMGVTSWLRRDTDGWRDWRFFRRLAAAAAGLACACSKLTEAREGAGDGSRSRANSWDR